MFDPENEDFAAAMRNFGLACMGIFMILLGYRDDPQAAAQIGGLLSFAGTIVMIAHRSGKSKGGLTRAVRIVAGRDNVDAAETPRLWFASWLAAMSAGFWALTVIVPLLG
ncbi:MAG: hypothetical protein H6883_02905 [Rhodobiaceae bacterium]|nr:hypothetical protein [Rhodobiaceae bacterium]MCC0055067.1 hypothetical protein [Rhodobiaceae bacterium]